MMPCAGRNCWSIFKVSSFAGLGLEDYDCGVISAGALLTYLLETQKNSLSNLTHLTPYVHGKIYDAGQLDKKKSGAVRDTPGKAEKRFPSVGAG